MESDERSFWTSCSISGKGNSTKLARTARMNPFFNLRIVPVVVEPISLKVRLSIVCKLFVNRMERKLCNSYAILSNFEEEKGLFVEEGSGNTDREI